MSEDRWVDIIEFSLFGVKTISILLDCSWLVTLDRFVYSGDFSLPGDLFLASLTSSFFFSYLSILLKTLSSFLSATFDFSKYSLYFKNFRLTF